MNPKTFNFIKKTYYSDMYKYYRPLKLIQGGE